ncbi:MAG TPA: hypothetical protein VHZ76_00785 [Gammaproteobacteria bacterium]|nr:hypothetical protein [Gammaproteobacteria bacterium]
MPIRTERRFNIDSQNGKMKALIENKQGTYYTTIYGENILISELEQKQIDGIIDFLISIKITMAAAA